MPGIARTVERMLDALGYQQVDVLGASLGGVVAQQLARQAPHRVRRLVLAATGPGLGGIPGSPRALLALATPRRYHQPGYYQRIAARIYGGAARRDPDSPRLTLAAESAAGPSLHGYLGQIYAISGWTSLPWLRTLRQQTLVLAGDDDPIVPVANGRILTRCIPHARLHIVRRGGHLFLLDSAAEMAGLVAAFLSGDDRRSRGCDGSVERKVRRSPSYQRLPALRRSCPSRPHPQWACAGEGPLPPGRFTMACPTTSSPPRRFIGTPEASSRPSHPPPGSICSDVHRLTPPPPTGPGRGVRSGRCLALKSGG